MYTEEEQKWMNQNLMRKAKRGSLREGAHLFSEEGLDFHSISHPNVLDLH